MAEINLKKTILDELEKADDKSALEALRTKVKTIRAKKKDAEKIVAACDAEIDAAIDAYEKGV